MNNVRAITITLIFEACAVNRDENIGGNMQSIKKLRRRGGIYSFLSRAFMRHKLFNALARKYSWKPAPVTVGTNNVIQFDLENNSIIHSEELDFFGYMSTVSETVVRKAPIGMTKAVSLEPWEGDMAFYANHDMVARAQKQGKKATPNPFSKEEHLSLYKFSIIMDLDRIGVDEVIVQKDAKIFGVEVREEMKKDFDGGYVEIKKLSKDYYSVTAKVNEDEKRKRICNFLDVVINGFDIHTSTESWSTTPMFAIVATLNLPLTLFNPYVKLNENGLDSTSLTSAIENTSVLKVWMYPGMFKVGVKGVDVVESPKKLYEKICAEIS